MIKLFNPGSGPVVYDKLGHSLGGTERVEVEALDSVGERAVKRGRLLIEASAEEEESKPSPEKETPLPQKATAGAGKNKASSTRESAESTST